MATTPTYSWPIPDDTGLVKDGAEAIRDLGNAIDTTVDGLGVGLVHINTTDYSAVSAVSLPNDTFTSTYQNYRILARIQNSTGANITFRFRTAGTNNSTANYNKQEISANTTSVSGLASTGQTAFLPSAPSGASTSYFIIDLFRPKEIAPTSFKILGHLVSTTSSQVLRDYTGNFALTTAFDSMSFLISSGNITGRIQTFGYRN
jgi:hypothetical protein